MKKYWLGIVGVVAMILGVVVYQSEHQKAAVTIIGGADGPTSIFLAGKLGYGSIIGGILVVLGVVLTVTFLAKRIRK